ncbi:uncharacterized protein LOC107496185 isoform X1 [Arachis duranensis]|uniref:Uncharacterized protein LOC107496185 isoform X1 n=1 Tax=Arachis duranensis TaxID=130453 RepID=A0A6P4DVG3_ARADU|nr:uncharacterized protein LOC107496185 isoform X1 [Arachis duranensis]XP_025668850.1 uncharacterized protein LOC112767179 isoform X1 [Arachis hypogaea]
MKRNCCLDLRLRSSSSHHRSIICRNEMLELHNKLVGIIHDGRSCMFDITELQARVIIWVASSQKVEERIVGIQTQALLMYASRGLSVKRSLQEFLQNRKRRCQSTHISNKHNSLN